MPLFRKRDGRQVRPTPQIVNNFIAEFSDGFQFEEFARMIEVLHGRSKSKGDTDDQKQEKTRFQIRSQDWAAEMMEILDKGKTAIEEGYLNKVEDLEATEADSDVKSLVDLHGRAAVAGALFKYSTGDGQLGDGYRIVGKGAQRRAKRRPRGRRS